MNLTKQDLEQYQKQADYLNTKATAEIAIARAEIATWIAPCNFDCRPHRLHWIGSKMEDAWNEYDKLVKACEKLTQTTKPSEAPTLYSTITTAYMEIEDSIRSIKNLMK